MKAYLAIKELQERLDLIENDFADLPELRSYAEALWAGIEALKAQICAESGFSEKVMELLNEKGDEDTWSKLANYLDHADEDDGYLDDHIDEDIQAADMAAEDMEDNTEEEW